MAHTRPMHVAKLRFAALLASFRAVGITALPNGYGMRPGMGWEGDYQNPLAPGPGRGNATYIATIATFFATHKHPSPADGLQSRTLQELGYWYVNPSSSWDEFDRSASGELVPRADFYPQGIEATVEHIHSLGLAYGTYGDRGNLDCDKRPGQLDHEVQDAKYFASIGVDWLKEDSCYDSGDSAVAIQHYATLRDALNATGRKIWYALCGWEPFYASDPSAGNLLANSARIGPDTGSGWEAVLKNVDNTHGIGQFAGAHPTGGYWNDGSLQLSPGTGCSGSTHACVNDTMCASPLQCVDGNLPLIATNDPFTMATWTNEEAIAINQDAAAWTATRYGRRLDAYVPLVSGLQEDQRAAEAGATTLPHAHVAECGGEPQLQQWVLGSASNFTVQCPAASGRTPGSTALRSGALYVALDDCHTDLVYDGCTFDPNALTCAGRGNYTHFQFDLGPDGALRSRFLRNYCITHNPSDDSVFASPCGAALPVSQQWHYENKQLMPGNTSKCLTASPDTPPAPLPNASTAVFGRPLTPASGASRTTQKTATGAYAVLMLNNGPNASNVTCDRSCVANMLLPASFPATAYVRDLWAHAALAPVADIRAGFALPVAGGGASRLVKLCATAAECTTPVTV